MMEMNTIERLLGYFECEIRELIVYELSTMAMVDLFADL